MVQTSLSFLVNPHKAQALAASANVERRPALVACNLILLMSVLAIWFTATALVSRPLEGFINLGELGAAALIGRYVVQKLNHKRRLSDRLKRLCVIVSSIAVVWICAGALLLSLCVIFKLNIQGIGAVAIIVEFVFWGGMLVHVLRAGSRVAALMMDNAPSRAPDWTNQPS